MMRFLYWAALCCAALNFVIFAAVPNLITGLNLATTILSFLTVRRYAQ